MSEKFRIGALAMCSALVVVPIHLALAQTSAPQPPDSLHDRIARANLRTPPADPKVELAAINALKAEAAGNESLAVQDSLILDKLYAVARAHNGDYVEAAAILTEVVARARAAGLNRDPLLGDLLENLGTMESLKGDPVSGLRDLLAAAEVMRAVPKPDMDELAAIEGSIGYTYLKMGRVVDAVAHYRAAIDGREPAPQAQSAYLSNVNNLVNAYTRLGDFEAALTYSKFGIEKAQQYLPSDHVGFAYFFMNTAAIYLELGRLEEAEALYRRALTVLDAHPDANRSLRGVIVGKLSDVLRERGMLAEARSLALASIDIVKDAKSSDQDTVGTAWFRLARLSIEEGNSATAITEATRALEEFRSRGDTTGASWRAREVLARALLFDGDLPGALADIDLAVAAVRLQVPEGAPGRVGVEMLRALILARMGRGDEAWQSAEPLGEIMARRMSDGHVSQRERSATAKVYRLNLARLADIAFATGRPDAAFRAAQLASFSEISASSLALAARAAGGNEQAARLARSVQDLQERSDRLLSERNFAIGKSADYVAAIDARTPHFAQEAHGLAKSAANLTQKRLSELMHISPRLAKLNAERFRDFPDLPERQALFAFAGDVYIGLEAHTLDEAGVAFAQDHVRMLSGLYGLLRPLDAIRPYRLEMGTRWAPRHKKLTDWWGDRIAQLLLAELAEEGSGVVLNLASQEYYAAVADQLPGVRVIDVEFREPGPDGMRFVSFNAKRARGMMARWLCEHHITDVEAMRGFDSDGYRFAPDESDADRWRFNRA